MLQAFLRCACSVLCGASILCAQTPVQPVQRPAPAAQPSTILPPGLYAYIDTSMGQIVCRLLPSQAPATVANFQGLATGTKHWTNPRTGKQTRLPFYSGLTFHRVIKNFMIQGGDPLGTGEGGPGFSIDDESTPDLHFDKPGMLAMAKRSDPNSAGSQFFITTAPAPWIEGKYSIFGEVAEGQDVVDKISEVATDESDKPQAPVVIRKITIRKTPTAASASTPAKAKPRSTVR